MRVKNNERIKIYQDDNILVVEPLTFNASCKYGAYTQWCTAAVSNGEYYERYSAQGILLYMIIKSPFPNVDHKEYKFALYIDEHNHRWYDQGDNEYNGNPFKHDDTEGLEGFDPRIIQFIIPKTVYDFIVNYGNEKMKELSIYNKKLTTLLFKNLVKDKNTKIITKNKELVMFYYKGSLDPLKYSLAHDSQLSGLFAVQNDEIPRSFIIYIYNKRKRSCYVAYMDYHIEDKTFLEKHMELISFDNYGYVSNDDREMYKTFIGENTSQIMVEYFQNKIPQTGKTIITLGKYVNPGDLIYQRATGEYKKVLSISECDDETLTVTLDSKRESLMRITKDRTYSINNNIK